MPPGLRWSNNATQSLDRHSSGRRPRLLLICDYRPHEAATVLDHIEAIRRWSQYETFVLPTFGDLPDGLDLDAFDGVAIHYNVVMVNDAYLSPLARWRIRQYRGVKAAFIQDEYRFVDRTTSVMRTLGINVLFTHVPQDQVEQVYRPEALPSLKRTLTLLTGYVPAPLLEVPIRPFRDRVVDVGYRGRRLSPWLGRLGQEKSAIADQFAADAPRFGLATDISCEEGDRLYGNAWIEFLSRSKAMLGVESGASIFDFDGSIEASVRAAIASRPDLTFEEIHRDYLTGVEGRIRLNQISPRCFEAAALGTLMILYPGEYSGILQPWRHYVPLEKDHSNMGEVVGAVRDEATWQRITQLAREEVALNPRNGYPAMVSAMDRALDLSVSAQGSVDPLAFERMASSSLTRMPMTRLHAFGLPPAINRRRLRAVRAVRAISPSAHAMSTSPALQETPAQRFRRAVGYLRTLAYWSLRPRVLPWAIQTTHGSALLGELTILGRLQTFGRRAYVTGAGSPFVAVSSRHDRVVRVVVRDDWVPTGTSQPNFPADMSWAASIALSIRSSDPWVTPGGIEGWEEGPLPALSAVLRENPDVARRLIAGTAPWCLVALTSEPVRRLEGAPARVVDDVA